MEFGWTDEQARRYRNTVSAVRGLCDREHNAQPLTAERRQWLRLGDLGLLGLSVPESHGGSGLSAVDTARTVEAFGRACGHTGLVFGACAHLFACAMPIAEFGGDALRSAVLPRLCSGKWVAANAMTEPEAGSDVSRLAVTARKVAGGWVLDGHKSFVSNGPVADVFVTYATSDPGAGPFNRTAFAVDRGAEGLAVSGPLAKMGLDDCLAGELRFTGCFVPDERVLGEPGQGGIVFQHSMGWERVCLFAGYLGLADRLIDDVVAHARSRRQFGAPLARFQAVSHRVADMVLRTESARLLLYRACWEMDRGEPSTLAAALSKLAVSEGVTRTAMDAVQIFGARGYLRSGGVEAALRDAVPSTLFSGTSEIQRELIARELGL